MTEYVLLGVWIRRVSTVIIIQRLVSVSVISKNDKKTGLDQTLKCYSQLVQLVEEFENLYYQQQVDCMHFCCPCIHILLMPVSKSCRRDQVHIPHNSQWNEQLVILGRKFNSHQIPLQILLSMHSVIHKLMLLKVYIQTQILRPGFIY